jgi:hypothetical protein
MPSDARPTIKKERKPAMPIHIDLSTPENMQSFEAALLNAMRGGRAVDLGYVAEASGTLQGLRVCFETPHFQIIDAGHDWKARGYTCRFAMQRRPEFSKSRVMKPAPATSDVAAECLIGAMNAAEEYHVRNAGYVGKDA